MTESIATDPLVKVAELRLLVGYLGEKDQCGWWDCSFLSPTGNKFLEHPFPRTRMLAAMTGVTEAARRLHDERMGVGNVFHLFRLPTVIEERLHGVLQAGEIENPEGLIESKERALEVLKSLFDSPVSAPEGPVQVGTGDKILSEFGVSEMAKHYHDAFSTEKQTFPYFTANANA